MHGNSYIKLSFSLYVEHHCTELPPTDLSAKYCGNEFWEEFSIATMGSVSHSAIIRNSISELLSDTYSRRTTMNSRILQCEIAEMKITTVCFAVCLPESE